VFEEKKKPYKWGELYNPYKWPKIYGSNWVYKPIYKGYNRDITLKLIEVDGWFVVCFLLGPKLLLLLVSGSVIDCRVSCHLVLKKICLAHLPQKIP